jgi:chemotaxis family two-component system response regulator Rcp1
LALEILLVEDNPGDARLTQEAFRDVNRSVHMNVACDGLEAIAFLKHQGSHAQSPRPVLILLDLNLPKMDGREVLAQIKQDDDLRTIPTVVLTTSRMTTDINSTYQLHANCYITKPTLLNELDEVVNRINDFWLKYAKLPVEVAA